MRLERELDVWGNATDDGATAERRSSGLSKAARPLDLEERDHLVRRVILVEGAANAAVLLAKVVVGVATGSLTVLADAIHSLTDLANNAVAWVVVRLSSMPPDPEHPYGHRKFETLAVFVLATLLTVLAFQLALRAIEREVVPIASQGWALVVMLGVLATNVALAAWEGGWARRLDSSILGADARHTFADVLTTVVVIGGWQLAARGYPWLDSVFALAVAGLVFYLAYGLFRRAIPVLVDHRALEPEAVIRAVGSIPGVRTVRSLRSRWTGASPAVDMVVTVDADLSTARAHEIADAIEATVRDEFDVEDITVHIEPN
jgi:cation diffusion facilitator family transporter